MPRPTVAQLAYGSLTVVLTTLAMLLLSRTDSAAGIAVAGTAALLLGLLVAMTVPRPAHATPVRRATPRPAVRVQPDPVSAAVEAEGLARDAERGPAAAPHETAPGPAAPCEGPAADRPSLRR
ncbi:hypothetical protein ACFVWY_18775 [Streptomyces sp. NPDC058195]|uniref:hypothetical protein n=1 Tax=Streptomyces sp. NPDC058195 TaxID=3346375 RepID=UPI0036E5174E